MRHHIHTSRVTLGLMLLAVAVPLVGCGPTVFADATALAVVGEPPAPPPVVEAPPPEPEKPKRVTVTADAIVITEKIMFEYDKADIRPESFELCDEIVKVIQDNPRIKKISIEGHTDGDGTAKYNKKLSQKRADAVMKYFTEHGVDAARLASVGHGEDVAIGDNATDEGKEKNRRVEFLILEQSKLTETVEVDPETGDKKVIDSKVEATPGPAASGSDSAAGTAVAPVEPKSKAKGPPAKAAKKGGE